MRKFQLLLIIAIVCSNNLFAQTIEGLELHFLSKTPKIELFKELWLEAYLVNKSSVTIKMFKVGNSEHGWNGYEEKWEGTLNGKPMHFNFFLDAPSSRFSIKSIVSVAPGDSIYAGLIRYTPIAGGQYKIIYTLSQDPLKVAMNYAQNEEAKNKAKEISTFSVTTKPFEFKVDDIKIGEVEIKEISDEELANKPVINNLKQAFTNPSEVYKLYLNGNITDDVMLKICELKNLKILVLSVSGINVIPEEISQLNLNELSINKLDGIKFPKSPDAFKSLKKLSLDNLEITEFPAFIEQLANLEILSIRNCPITNVSNGIEKLKKLKELELNSVNITNLNPKVSGLVSLEKLSISRSLVSFPEISGCKNLKELNLSYNKNLNEISAGIGQLKELEKFNMAITGITKIPKEISGLKKLKELSLSNNKITEIPAALYGCTSLQKIDLSNNLISVAAPGIDKLVNLMEFSAYKNKIEKLPAGLSKCPKIERVWVHTNNIKGNDEEGTVLEQKLGKKYCYKR